MLGGQIVAFLRQRFGQVFGSVTAFRTAKQHGRGLLFPIMRPERLGVSVVRRGKFHPVAFEQQRFGTGHGRDCGASRLPRREG